MLLESHNGGVPIRDSHVTCSIEQIIDLRESTIKGDVIPLSCDIDDDYLVIDRSMFHIICCRKGKFLFQMWHFITQNALPFLRHRRR